MARLALMFLLKKISLMRDDNDILDDTEGGAGNLDP